jgi:hypothetical protein
MPVAWNPKRATLELVNWTGAGRVIFFFVVVAFGFSLAAKISTALGVRVRLSVHHRMPEAVGHMGSSARSSLLLTLFVLVCSCSLF